jgi:hypothetical protein
MSAAIKIIRRSREQLVELIDRTSVNQLNIIPQGFRNNIIWNIGHLLVALEGITYRRAGLPLNVDPVLATRYGKGSIPAGDTDENEIAEIKSLLVSSIDCIEVCYMRDGFANYTPWTTSQGFELPDIDAALAFGAYHEGLHSNCIDTLLKFIQ